jgi:hypothetical protein
MNSIEQFLLLECSDLLGSMVRFIRQSQGGGETPGIAEEDEHRICFFCMTNKRGGCGAVLSGPT